MSPTVLVLLGLASVLAILVLIIKARTHPFLALLLVSVALALVAGIPLREVVPLLKDGMGGTLGGVALIVTLGAMLGAIVDISGGARVLAAALERAVGEKRAPLALGAASFLFGIPVFVDVATIVLVPIVLAVARRMSGRVNMLAYALPTVAALLTVHVVLPPHPGIVGGAEVMKADVGLVLVIGLIPSIVMWLVGQWLSSVIAKRVFSPVPELHAELSGAAADDTDGTDGASARAADPSVGMVLAAILLPLALIMAGTVSALFMDEGDPIADLLAFIGNSPIALLIGVLFASITLGFARGWSVSRLEEVLAAALPATAAVILITGAGGTFGAVLTATGVADAVADLLTSTGLPILVLAWLLAAMIRAAQGSATVATLTTAPLILPMTASMGLSAPQIALVTVTIGIGSMAFSHVNDSLFWVWSRYFGVSTSTALKSYTVTVTLMSLAGFAVALVLWALLAVVG
ncbi:GntT/GntP/DsdX family permease [Helcobacillus massiliensis]|uniref:GntT/GntP/DsdX family permease n=1 Tax=Helcobacillus massiliensis TaxID=521392 RepID=UPI002556F5BF|nr:gluconate:H+ symporter [Helcobacillus massiliensis]MDK7741298.1 gluconate:H+ symporter [Helcobacillus massiliensis]WOO92850.1 gluconate:H+ symporter [Helcobacillus massiliensis]